MRGLSVTVPTQTTRTTRCARKVQPIGPLRVTLPVQLTFCPVSSLSSQPRACRSSTNGWVQLPAGRGHGSERLGSTPSRAQHAHARALAPPAPPESRFPTRDLAPLFPDRARALGDPVGGECAAIQGAAGEYAPDGMTKQVRVGLMVTWKGKWNNFSVGNCRAAMTWLRLVKAQGGITTKGGGLLGVKLYVVDVSAETAVGNGVLSVGGTKTPTYTMGKQFITDNGLDVSLTPYSSSLSPYAGKAGFETGVPVVATGAAAESVFACPECDDATDCATEVHPDHS